MRSLIALFTLLFFNTNLAAQLFVEVHSALPFDGVAVSSMAFVDIDGDQDQDLIIIEKISDEERITKLYYNDGSGGYTEGSSTPFEGLNSSSVAFADIDGDQDQDLIITAEDYSGRSISKFFRNDGAGAFTELSDTPFTGEVVRSIAFADIDGDQDQDFIITRTPSGWEEAVNLYLNNGSGAYTKVTVPSFEGRYFSSVTFADVDGDQDQDLIATGSNVQHYLNDGSGGYTEVTGRHFDSGYFRRIAIADIDGDQDHDLIVTGFNRRRRRKTDRVSHAKLYRNDGTGKYTEITSAPFTALADESLAFADIDGDQDHDLIITGRRIGSEHIARLYRNEGAGEYTEIMSTPFPGVNQSKVAFADVDGDQDQDLIITGQNADGVNIAKLYLNEDLNVSSASGVQVTPINLFPNPTDGLLRLDEITAEIVSVFQLTGQVVAEFSQPGDQLDLSGLPTGTYLLRILDEDGRHYSARVVKE